MAGGGKETPRQRMIGLMYLVLMAMLALNVSNSVLDKFIFIDQSLRLAVENQRKENDKRVHAIEEKVEKRSGGNAPKPKDKAVLDKAHEVHKMTNELISYMEEFREQLSEKSGGKDEHGQLVNKSDYQKHMVWSIGFEGKKDGEGYVLEKKLKDYINTLNSSVDSLDLGHIAKPASEYPELANNPDQKTKDFVYLTFDHTPAVAALTMISQIKTDVAQAEAKALEKLALKIGAEELRFDKIVAVVKPESKVVAAGTKYRAEMFIAASSSTARPRMTFNGKPVSKIEEGKGFIEFPATAGNYDKEGNAKKTWKGAITISGPMGDTTFEVEEEYIVAKPVIQIQSASISALYLNCGNELNIQVPALGSAYDPNFKVTGGDVIKGSKKGFITVVPNKPKVDISVFSSGNKIGVEKFGVKKIPAPTIQFLDSQGKPVDQKNGVTKADMQVKLRSISAAAVPDPGFAEALPKDARYRVVEWEITLARGRRAVGTPIRAREPKVAIAQLARNAQAGDRLVIEVKKVMRMNFKNKTEPVDVGMVIAQIPVN